MNKSAAICGFVMLIAGLGSTAKAMTWTFTLESLDGNDLELISPDAVPTDAPSYDYDWEITEAQMKWVGQDWTSILDNISPTSGFGSSDTLPIIIFDDLEPLHIDLNGLVADIHLSVLSSPPVAAGHGIARLVNMTFGQTPGGGTVTGARFVGDLTVIPIPEPATVALLGLGSLILIRRKGRV